jgi:hypothetical protein
MRKPRFHIHEGAALVKVSIISDRQNREGRSILVQMDSVDADRFHALSEEDR